MSLARAYIWWRKGVNVRTTRTERKRDRYSYTKHARRDVRWSTHNGSNFPKVSIAKTRSLKEGNVTYIDVSFHVSNQDEVTRTGVADVGVHGDRAPRVSLDGIGGL